MFPFLSLELISKFPVSSKNNATKLSFCLFTAVENADNPSLSFISIFAPAFNKRTAIAAAKDSGSRKHSWIKAVFPSLSFKFKFAPRSIKKRTCLKRRSEIALFTAAIFSTSRLVIWDGNSIVSKSVFLSLKCISYQFSSGASFHCFIQLYSSCWVPYTERRLLMERKLIWKWSLRMFVEKMRLEFE